MSQPFAWIIRTAPKALRRKPNGSAEPVGAIFTQKKPINVSNLSAIAISEPKSVCGKSPSAELGK